MSNSSNKNNNKSSKKKSTNKSNTTKNNTVTKKQESKPTTIDTTTANTKTSVDDKLVKQYTKAELAQEYSKLQEKFDSVKKELDRTKSFSSTV